MITAALNQMTPVLVLGVLCAFIMLVAVIGVLLLVLRRRRQTPSPMRSETHPATASMPHSEERLQAAIQQAPGAMPGATAAYIPGSASAASPHDLAAHFPQLEIVELLGKGGMGAVYKARQPHLDRFIALKVLPADAARDPAFVERFSREAKAMARLSHPNIVAVHDYGKSGDLCWLMMEYVDGVNVRQAMRGGLPAAEAVRVTNQLCDALQFAHDEGIVHRDIKPENILLDRRGRVKVADFGLAKLLGRAADTGLTATQQVMGTLHYMAPEQLAGARAVDHRADIYSLGVTFYEMLTGELPLGRFPPPSKTPGVDARLDAIVLRALEREPAERYQQASEVKTAIDSIVRAASVSERGEAPSLADARGSDIRGSDTGWGGWWLQQPLRTRQTVKLILWILMIASAIVFGSFGHSRGQTEKLVIGLIQPWYESESSPQGGTRVWNLWTVSGIAGHLVLICICCGIVTRVWEILGQPQTPDETLRKARVAGGWLIATGIVTILAFIPALGLAIALEQHGGLGNIWPWMGPLLSIQTPYSLAAGGIMIFGGASLRRVRRYGWALTGCILAMIPLSMTVLLGLPVGVECVTLLSRRDVRDEFERAAWLAKNREFQSSQGR